ncbi:MAG TPA: adenylate/guanylate cyclase domain-containing protein [Dehalococcoidia bacterium]
MEPRIQYARTSDGVRIAFTTFGAGPPVVFTPPAAFGNFVGELQIPEHQAWLQRVAERYTVILYDSRDGGSSQRDVEDVSLEGHVRDLEAVADRLNLEQFNLFGFYHTSLAAIIYAARHPERVARLLLWHSYAKASDRNSTQLTAVRSLRDQSWEVYLETLARTSFGWSNESASIWAKHARDSLSPEAASRMLAGQADYDVTEYLPQVKTPTLIVYRRNARRYSADLGLGLASQIPGAQLQLLNGEEMVYSAGDNDEVFHLMDEFFSDGSSRPVEPHQAAGSIVTILFADIEDHSTVMHRLGDEQGRAVFREYEAMFRDALRRNGGTEIKTMDDGFMASFASAYRALECATELQRTMEARNQTSDTPLHLRIGLNAGEPIAEHDDLFGSAVILASRTANKAKGGEVLVTDVVRQLAAGKGFMFSDLGDTELRGFEDPVRLFELRWR